MDDNLLELTTRIVEAHLRGAGDTRDIDIPATIAAVYAALKNAESSSSGVIEGPEVEKPQGAVTARKSLSNDNHILSMIDGKPYKTLKRHISGHGYTPESYRETFGLAADYPMVSRNYSAQRSEMAKSIGLGKSLTQKRGRKAKAK
ncbi:MucR family transcriptional regulator [Tsuneonella sp. HG094]